MELSIARIISALAAGGGLGALFFLGLRWTVRRLPSARSPILLAVMSLIIRMAIVLAGMAWLAHENWTLLIPALIGFVAVRQYALSAWVPADSARLWE